MQIVGQQQPTTLEECNHPLSPLPPPSDRRIDGVVWIHINHRLSHSASILPIWNKETGKTFRDWAEGDI